MNPKPPWVLFTVFITSLASAAPLAKPPAVKAAPADDISAPPRGTPNAGVGVKEVTVGDHVLWDHWYTVTVKSGSTPLHYEYYSDHAEIKKGRVIFQNHAWKQEEGYVNEEQVGAFAENNPELTPLFFNFHSNYRASELSIDGNVRDVKDIQELTVRIRQGDIEQPLKKKQLPHKVFFSELFPVWLGYHLETFKKGQTYSFQTLLEDNLEADFVPVHGTLRVEAPDDLATRNHATKLSVEYRNLRSIWWVQDSGSPIRIELPTQHTVVERVSKETAQSFLGKK